MHHRNIPITVLKIGAVSLLLKVVSKLKFGHLFFMASFDHINLGGSMENPKYYFGFWCGKKQRFWFIIKWKYQFWIPEALG